MSGRIISGDREIKFDRLMERAARAAAGFKSVGIEPNDAVALLLRNDIAFFEASLGAGHAGAYGVPINWHNSPEEVAYILEDSGAKALVVHADLLARARAYIPAGLPVLVVSVPDDIAAAYQVPEAERGVPAGGTDWDAWVDSFAPAPPPTGEPPSTMIYTSGTTGRPKGVRRAPPTAEQMAGFSGMLSLVFGVEPGVRTAIIGPMYHSAPNSHGLSMARAGGEVWLAPRFDPEGLLRMIQEHRLTNLYMVPTMFVRLLKLPEEVRRKYDTSSIKHIVIAAAPCPRDVKQKMIEWWGPVITEFYGSTETGAVTFCNSQEALDHPGTVGKPIPGVEMLILDEAGNPLPQGEIGEVYARNMGIMNFTYHRDQAKRDGVEKRGLITSGDVGYFDRDGFLHLCDRRKDMVISGGVNIYPAEIEACLLGLHGVHDCAVFGIPDEEYGESLAAVIQLQPGASLDAGAIRSHVREHLAGYKVPKVVEFASDLPREDSGKIFKRKLREPYWAATGRAI
ncbi:acyl-CoA synthetase [Zavarzinia sp. CC-PAN008]|uniref:acyl-CoA synthetase n=1 Tax=Zavarzinia sp. CC-PAN008 TaxID=3243332 RepID=UPI003F74A6AE